ncbi:MAG: hypothetical protein ABSG68_04910 [Thermoguttaceae bacterium]
MTCAGLIGLALTVVAPPARAAVIISTDFVSTGSTQYLNGTQTGLTTDLPGGNWIWGAGWDWGAPLVQPTWMGGTVQNAAYLSEEKTALGLSLATAGAYTKPTQMTVSADLMLAANGNGEGLGFWSTIPPQVDGGPDSLTNFTGVEVTPGGSLQLYVNGAASGSAVSTGITISSSTFYNLSYNVNTTTGAISNVSFAGSAVNLTGTGFTDAATAYVGALSTPGARVILGDLNVSGVLVSTSTIDWAALLQFGHAARQAARFQCDCGPERRRPDLQQRLRSARARDHQLRQRHHSRSAWHRQ